MRTLHIISQRRGGHFTPTHLVTYPGSFPFPKGWSLPCSSPLVCLRSLLPPDEPQHAYHCLGLTQVRLQANPLKHSYHGCQESLYPDWVSPCYPLIIRVKADVVFSLRPYEPMLSFLGSTDFLKGLPDHCIHYDIKNCRDTGSPCVTPLPVLKGQRDRERRNGRQAGARKATGIRSEKASAGGE